MNQTDRDPRHGRTEWRHLVSCIQAAKRRQESAAQRARPEADRSTRLLAAVQSLPQER